MSQHKLVKIAFKYCGSCNPQVDLSRVVRYLLAHAAGECRRFELVPFSANDIDVILILCGCPRACANKPEVRARAGHSLVIAGQRVADAPVSEVELPGVVEREILSIVQPKSALL